MSKKKLKPFHESILSAIVLSINQSRTQMGATTLGGLHNVQNLLSITKIPENKIDGVCKSIEECKSKTSSSDVLEVLNEMIKDLKGRKPVSNVHPAFNTAAPGTEF